ncbi:MULTISPECIES: pseudoazurin [Hyphomicrobiales]|jgi:pseudoazurin|uniref:Pseudoazurin n=3 Tax=Phyllobacteriaceae TaxID=69277 RepID=K2NXR1_9HYPH|nr:MULTISPECIES: pseudoazurin [Hyphomicrobiales]EKF39881.1 pseudoazurin [Nitratireductor indicus C115]EXL03676.1 pseudoazurin [Aquamicrobium defluvii]EZQ15214.1 pseudoazurin [Halopseudomonas bauzanensis]SFQ63507.1 pseudoazurin [Nitratireductor indicus]
MFTRREMLAGSTALTVVSVLPARAQTGTNHEVQMLNKGTKGVMVYEPDFVTAAIGDTVTFIPTDKSHNAESIKGMLPEGAEPFKGKLNEEITITIEKEGVYGVKCTPHYGMGMVMLIAVGAPGNMEEARAVKHPPKAKKLFDELLDAVPAA